MRKIIILGIAILLLVAVITSCRGPILDTTPEPPANPQEPAVSDEDTVANSVADDWVDENEDMDIGDVV